MSAKIEYNSGQRTALDRAKIWLQGKEKFFVLTGGAGVGKTTIAREIALSARKYPIYGGALSHSAKNVLSDSIGGIADCYTLTQLVGKKQVVDRHGRVSFRRSYSADAPTASDASFLVVDECSMVDQEMFDDLDDLTMNSCKILFMGDRYQLPPVSGNGADSPVFLLENRAELTESMRFNDIIGNVANIFPRAIDALDYRQMNPAQVIDMIRSYHGYVDGDGDSYVEFTSDVDHFNGMLCGAFASNPESTRIIAYHNSVVAECNTSMRNYLYGNPYDKWLVGEEIIMNKPYGDSIYNGDSFRIDGIKKSSLAITTLIKNKHTGRYRNREMRFEIDLLRLENNGKYHDDIPVINRESEQHYAEVQDRLYNQGLMDKSFWVHYHKFIDNFADASLAYALTSHKSQGQSIDNVFVMLSDIMSAPGMLRTKLQSLYVACSRARKNLIIFM